jgi:hypothetical protein
MSWRSAQLSTRTPARVGLRLEAEDIRELFRLPVGSGVRPSW